MVLINRAKKKWMSRARKGYGRCARVRPTRGCKRVRHGGKRVNGHVEAAPDGEAGCKGEEGGALE